MRTLASGFLPRMLRALMVVSALAMVVVVTALIGELPLTPWLLIKGVNVERWQRRALEAGSW